MARFSDLPPELVLNILRHVDPRNLVSACILSKSVFLLAASILKEHRRLTKEYSTSLIDTCPDIFQVDLFDTILATPQNADYVRDLTVGLISYRAHDVISSHDDTLISKIVVNRSKSDYIQSIKTAIKNTKQICTNETDVWLQAAEHSPEYTVLALRIVFLPNLERLKLKEDSLTCGYASILTRTIRNAPTSKTLYHLRHLTIRFPRYNRWTRSEYVKFVTAFLSLPSLAFCCVKNLRVDDDESDPQRYLHPHESAVHEIQFHGCRIGPKTLFEILEGTKCLSSISYISNEYRPPRGSKPLDWYWLAVGLSRYARHSLEKVILKPCGSVHASLCDFRQFTLLREIEAEMALLFSDNSLKAQIFPWMLPASLHILRLRFRTTDSAQRESRQRLNLVEQIKDVTHTILKVKQVLLPLLTEIQLFTDCCVPAPFLERTTFMSTQEACNLQGISLRLVESNEYGKIYWRRQTSD